MAENITNRTQLKKFILRQAGELRAEWKPTRVKGTFLDDIEARVRLMIQRSLKRHRSNTKTVSDLF